MDLGDDADINFAENDENIMPNEGELDEQELIDGGDISKWKKTIPKVIIVSPI